MSASHLPTTRPPRTESLPSAHRCSRYVTAPARSCAGPSMHGALTHQRQPVVLQELADRPRQGVEQQRLCPHRVVLLQNSDCSSLPFISDNIVKMSQYCFHLGDGGMLVLATPVIQQYNGTICVHFHWIRGCSLWYTLHHKHRRPDVFITHQH